MQHSAARRRTVAQQRAVAHHHRQHRATAKQHAATAIAVIAGKVETGKVQRALVIIGHADRTTIHCGGVVEKPGVNRRQCRGTGEVDGPAHGGPAVFEQGAFLQRHVTVGQYQPALRLRVCGHVAIAQRDGRHRQGGFLPHMDDPLTGGGNQDGVIAHLVVFQCFRVQLQRDARVDLHIVDDRLLILVQYRLALIVHARHLDGLATKGQGRSQLIHGSRGKTDDVVAVAGRAFIHFLAEVDCLDGIAQGTFTGQGRILRRGDGQNFCFYPGTQAQQQQPQSEGPRPVINHIVLQQAHARR